jgi:hypothetical protein
MASVVKESFAHTVNVDANRIGTFVGKSGYFIKTRVVFPSKAEYLKRKDVNPDAEGNYDAEKWSELKVHCHVDTLDGKVQVTLKCSDKELHDIALEHVMKYVEQFNAPKPEKTPKTSKSKGQQKTKNEFRKYFFKVLVSEDYIGRLIGIEGSNVTEFAEQLQNDLDLQRRPYVKIMSQGSDKVETINIPDVESGQIWISVQLSGPKSFSPIKKAVKSFVIDTLVDQSDNGDDEEASGWGGDNQEAEGGW